MSQLLNRYPRYCEEEASTLPGYTIIHDRVSKKHFLGRRFPQGATPDPALKWLTHVQHFGLFPVFFLTPSSGEWVTVSPYPPEIQSFYPKKVKDVSSSDMSRSFFNYLWGLDFLFRHGFLIKQFSIKHCLYDPQHKGRLGYMEDLLPLEELDSTLFQHCFNWAYIPPETLENQVFRPSSLEFYVGQVLIHLLSGSPHHRGSVERTCFLEKCHIKKEWKNILWRMTEPREKDRCGWPFLLKESAKLAGYSKRNLPSVRMFNRHKTALALPSDPAHSHGAVIQAGPGRESISIRNQLLEWSEKHNYLFLHLWQETPSKTPFESMNQLIDLVRGQFLMEKGLDVSIGDLPYLSSWKSEGENRLFWKPVVEELKRVLFKRAYRGITFQFEDLHHMDIESIAAFCTLFSWLQNDPIFFVVSTPFFLDKNLQVFLKHAPVVKRIYKPKRLSMEDLHHMTDGYQRARLETYYLKIHSETLGNQTLLMRELQGEQGALHFLERIWRTLKPAWQRFFSLLSCSFSPLKPKEIGHFIDWKSLPKRDLLGKVGLIEYDPVEGFYMDIPLVRSFCQSQMDIETRRHIWSKLLELDKKCGVQNLCLKMCITKTMLDPARAIDTLLRSPVKRWWALLESSELQEIEPDIAQALRVVIRSTNGHHAVVAQSGPASHFHNYQKALSFEKQGDWSQAVYSFKKSANQRGLPFPLKARSLVKAMRCLAQMDQPTGITRFVNQFDELQWSANDLHLKPLYVALIQGFGFGSSKIKAWNPGPYKSWPLACQAWRDDDFNGCLYYLEKLLVSIPAWLDDLERGDIFKLYGNALFKNNHPHLATKAYRESAQFYRSCAHEQALSSVTFNLASTEKLEGNLLVAIEYFHELLHLYRKKNDQLSESQVVFNLLEIALLRGQSSQFEELYLRHRELVRQTGDEEEKARGLIVGLFASLKRPKFLVEESLAELKEIVHLGINDPLIHQEAELAIRIASLRLHKPFLDVKKYGKYTQWRHRFLDYLLGNSDLSLTRLLNSEEHGFFKGLMIQLVVDSIEAGFLPTSQIPPFFLKVVQKYSQKNKAEFAAVFLRNMTVESMSENGKGPWDLKKHLNLLTRAHSSPLGPELVEVIWKELDNYWPFECWGKHNHRSSLFKPPGETLPPFLMNYIGKSRDVSAFVRSWFNASGDSCEYLFLPVGSAVFWFRKMGISHETIDPRRLLFFQESLSALITREKEHIEKLPVKATAPNHAIPDLITTRFLGESPPVMELKKQIRLFGNSNLGVHITGESGTGKELVARLLHDVSTRSQNCFRAINCCDFSENLIQSELFGHVKGAFTGAERDRIGIVEQVNGGSLFLDEIGDLTPKVQSLLLRFIQEKEFHRVGGNQLRKVDVRVITATNKSLQQLMDKDIFRSDLFFRIAETELVLPPLRSRPSDLDLLVPFLSKRNAPKRTLKFSQSFLAQLKAHTWPGNVRELENYLKKMLVIHPEVTLFEVDHMPEFLKTTTYDHTLLTMESWERRNRKELVSERLVFFGGNRTRTAESLGLSRQQLIRIIKKLDIG